MGVGKPLLLVLAILLPCCSQALFACGSGSSCNECEKDSQYSGNPDSTFVTKRLRRFYSREDQIVLAIKAEDYAAAQEKIDEYLELAAIYRCNWNYGNAIHDANRFRGLISLIEGDVDGAAEHLVEAGKSPGSPQLDSFGPELDLANELLKRGKTEEVIEYLEGINSFWKLDYGQVDDWIKEIERGDIPYLDRQARYDLSWMESIQVLVVILLLIALVKFIQSKRSKNPQ